MSSLLHVCGVLVSVVTLVAAGCSRGGTRNCVEGTVADENSAPFSCIVEICKHDPGQICNHTLEGMPCKLQRTGLTAEVKNGRFRIGNVPPVDRKELAYAVVVLAGTNKLQESFFIFPGSANPVHRPFTLPFANEGVAVNIRVDSRQGPGAPASSNQPLPTGSAKAQ